MEKENFFAHIYFPPLNRGKTLVYPKKFAYDVLPSSPDSRESAILTNAFSWTAHTLRSNLNEYDSLFSIYSFDMLYRRVEANVCW